MQPLSNLTPEQIADLLLDDNKQETSTGNGLTPGYWVIAHSQLLLDRFDLLAQNSGLAPLMTSYSNQGYAFLVDENGPYGTGLLVQIKRISFDFCTLAESPFPEVQEFQSAILHELGHCEALQQGLDVKDEALAWQLAQEICPIEIPSEWEAIKTRHLSGYALKKKGAQLSNEDTEQVYPNGICSKCKGTRFKGIRNSLPVGPDRPGEELIRCISCDAEFFLVWEGKTAPVIYYSELA
jgi:hypothetical protein